MVDEVNIKITADASEAKQAFRDIHFYEKALQEDTELLKDLQVEYKEALAETGGKLTGKALKLHNSILDIKASMAKSEREIEKAGKGQVKNQTKLLKGLSRVFGGKLAMFSAVGSVAGGLYLAKSLAENVGKIAQETRQEYLSSISTGMSGSGYSALKAGGTLSGVSSGNLASVLTNLNNGLLAFKTGIGDVGKLARLQNRTGISLTDEKGQYKTQERLLSDIQAWVKTQPIDKALYMLQDLGFTPDIIRAMKEGSIAENKMYATTEEERKRLDSVNREMNRMEASAEKRNKVLGSFFSPVAEGFYGLRADINDLLIRAFGEEEKKEDNRTPEEKREQSIRSATASKIVENENTIRELEESNKSIFTGWLGKKLNIRKIKQLQEDNEKMRYALKTGNIDALESGDYQNLEKQPLKDVVSSDSGSGSLGLYKYDGNGFTLNYPVVPEKSSSLTGSVLTNRVNQNADTQINIYGNANPLEIQNAAEQGIVNGFRQTAQQTM